MFGIASKEEREENYISITKRALKHFLQLFFYEYKSKFIESLKESHKVFKETFNAILYGSRFTEYY